MDKKQKSTTLAVMLTAFITSFTGSALNLAIPDISASFSVSAGTAGWIVTGYSLAVAVFSIPSGWAADRFGRKRILVTGLTLFTGASVAAVFCDGIYTLVATRALQGAAAAMIFSTNMAIMAARPPGARGRALGLVQAGGYVGLSAGPVAGGFLNHEMGWQSIFTVTAAISLVTLIISVKGLPPDQTDQHGPGPVSGGFRHILKNKPFICSNLAALLNYGATFAVSYLASVYLQTVSGHTSRTAGLILLIQPVIISVLAPLSGRASDKISSFKLSSWGMIVCASGILLWAGCLVLDAGFWLMVIALAVVAIGSALFSSPNTNAVISGVRPPEYSIASSTLATMRALGNTLGMMGITAISAVCIGTGTLKTAPPEAIVKATLIMLLVSVAACIAGAFLARKK